MVDVMISAPGGFMDAAVSANEIPADILAEMCQMVLKFIQHETGTVDTATLYNKCQSAGYTCTQECVDSIANVLTYIYRTASTGHLSADELLNQLRGSSMWNEKTLAIIIQFWQKQQGVQSDVSEQRRHSANTGKLVDLQWKFGVSVSSSTCKNLSSPFVTMTMKVAESSGHLKTQSVEMTIAQFQNFSKQLKEMAHILETV